MQAEESSLAWESQPQLLANVKGRESLLRSLFSTDSFRQLLKKRENVGEAPVCKCSQPALPIQQTAAQALS